MHRAFKMSLFAFLGLIGGKSHAADSRTFEGHVLTLQVNVAGKQIMAPSVELVENVPAVVEIDGTKPGERYALQLLLKTKQRIGKVTNAISVEGEFSARTSKSANVLAKPTIFITQGGNGSATLDSERGAVEISILTHALRQHEVTVEI